MSPMSTGASWTVLALLLVGGSYLAALAAVRRLVRMPLPFAAAVALAVLVCAETLLMDVLSLFDGVTRPGVAVGQGAMLLGASVFLRDVRRWPSRALARARHVRGPVLLVLPLAVLALVSALRYVPNTADSMTYHLARVAHWIQQASVEPYATAVNRQRDMMPGAEYVLLALQVVSGTDRLGALLQLGAYLVVVSAAPAVARLAGAPARYARWAAPIVAALPMAVLQASSTQNDLVAAAMATAVVATALRVGGARRDSPAALGRALLLAIACSGAVLVKATALLAALPVLLFAGARALGAGRRAGLARSLRTWLPAALLAALLVSPELARRSAGPSGASALPWSQFVYPVAVEWGDRAANVVRGVFHHLPSPRALPAVLRPRLTTWPGAILEGYPQLLPHEDVVGNPLHAGAVIAALLVLAFRFRRVPLRGRWAAGSLVAVWVLFHVTFRQNEYISRLQLPMFALAPALLAVLPRPRADRRGLATGAAAALTGAAVLVAVAVGVSNELRPPFDGRSSSPATDYYRTNRLVADAQQTALRVAREVGCRRLGLFMGESGYDYPLTWQAMQDGIEVRHVFGSARWPCVVYAEPSSFGFWNIRREPVALSPAEWLPAGANAGGVFLFRRRERAGVPPDAASRAGGDRGQ